MSKRETRLRCFLVQLAWSLRSHTCPFVLFQCQSQSQPYTQLRCLTPEYSRRLGEQSILRPMHLQGCHTSAPPRVRAKIHGCNTEPQESYCGDENLHGKVSTVLEHYETLIRFMWISVHINLEYRSSEPVGMRQIFKFEAKKVRRTKRIPGKQSERCCCPEFWSAAG